jgi:hypothetical protein
VNRLDQETAKRRGPTRAVEPFEKKKKKKNVLLIFVSVMHAAYPSTYYLL